MRKITYLFIIFGLLSLEPCDADIRNSRKVKGKYTSSMIASSEEQIVAEINVIRKSHGLSPLKLWTELSDCARDHSSNMAMEKVPFGHHGFEDRAEKMQQLGSLSSFGENVAYSFNCKNPVKVAVDGWMKSLPHRKNILGDFDETGLGVAIGKDGKFYATQLFAKRQRS